MKHYKRFSHWESLFVSFEVDTLEIVLRELEDIVDTFFLVESNGTHKGVIGLSSIHSAQRIKSGVYVPWIDI